MQFNGLINEIKSAVFDSLRSDKESYFEAVFLNDELTKLFPKFEKFFGLPAWPSEKPLPSQVEEIIGEFGGIMPGQTLYFCNDGSDYIVLMLWPWNDAIHTTVKIIKK
jgi:hypothetical protein